MIRHFILPLTLLVLAGAFADAAAQSLGDIARREEERRKTASSGKTYTNSSLPDTPKAEAPVPAPASPAAASASAGAADARKSGESKAPGTASTEGAKADVPEVREKRNEEYWRNRAAELRGRREALQKEITQLEGRVKELESEATGSASSARERDLTQTTLARARQNLGFFNDEWTRFQQKAQSAKVPAEWLQ